MKVRRFSGDRESGASRRENHSVLRKSGLKGRKCGSLKAVWEGASAGRKEFYIIGLSLLAALCVAGILTALYGRKPEAITRLDRPAAGEEDRSERLVVETGEGELSYTVEVPAGTYTEEEAEQFLLEARERLPELITGENISLDHVERDLNLVTELPGSPVAIRWSSDHPEYLRYDGTLATEIPEEGVSVALEAELTCQDSIQYYCQAVMVFPLSEDRQSWEEKLAAALQEANAEESREVYYLPDQVDHVPVVWRRTGDNPALPAALLVLAGGVLAVAGRRQKEKETLQNRKKELLLAYPELVSRMVLYLGAGLSVRQTFIRMAASGGREQKGQALQEELALTVQELSQGNTETAAYQHFGERSGLAEYRALSSLLVQNVRRGNRELLPMLQLEAEKAFKARGRQVKILGSEAGTKLLLPMVLLLVVVLVLILFPAIISFQA